MEHKIYENEEIRNMFTAPGVSIGTAEDGDALNIATAALSQDRDHDRC